LVLAVEDAVQVLLVLAAGLFGRRQVTVLPFIGHGTPQEVRVQARVVLGSPAARAASGVVAEAAIGDCHAGAAGTADSPGTADSSPDRHGAAEAAGSASRSGHGREQVVDGAGSRGSSSEADAGTQVDPDRRRSAAGGTESGASGGQGFDQPARGRPDSGAPPAPASRQRRWQTLRESMAPFLTIELPRCRVTVEGPAGRTTARCDRQGYLDVTVDAAGLPPGWHELTVSSSWRGRSTAAPAPVLVVDPAADVAVISDLDDTVIESGITRGLEVLRLTLFTSVTDRTPLPGAAELYRAMTGHGANPAVRPVFYLSTSPWNLYELLARFIALRGFPAGPLLLTDWGPSRTHLLRITAEQHKLTLIRSLLAQHPGLGVVLIGDTGQLDPEIYAAVATESPERVRAVYVRRTVNITGARANEVEQLARKVAAAGVPMLQVADSVKIAEHAAGLGLLDPADVQAVRRASNP